MTLKSGSKVYKCVSRVETVLYFKMSNFVLYEIKSVTPIINYVAIKVLIGSLVIDDYDYSREFTIAISNT